MRKLKIFDLVSVILLFSEETIEEMIIYEMCCLCKS